MESKVISLLLGALIYFANVECQKLEVKFDKEGPVLTNLGEQVEVKCIINKDAFYILKTTAQIIRVHNGEEVPLTKHGQLEDGEPDHYDVKIETSPADTTVILKIVKVTAEDDGYLLCRVIHTSDNEIAVARLNITVQRPLTSLKLKINGKVIGKSMPEPLELDSGTYEVSCIAEGSNPATTDVDIFQHGTKVNRKDLISELIEGDIRTYRTTISGQINITSARSGEDLECTGKANIGEKLSITFPISVKVYEPEIYCNDTYAYVGELLPTLTCTVHHHQSKLKSFSYYINEVEITAGDQSSEFNDVTKNEISPDQTTVTLRINKVEESHFDAKFYLVIIHEDGHVTRQPVTLHKIEDKEIEADVGGSARLRGQGGSSSGFLFASLVTVFLCVISAAVSLV